MLLVSSPRLHPPTPGRWAKAHSCISIAQPLRAFPAGLPFSIVLVMVLCYANTAQSLKAKGYRLVSVTGG